MSLRHVQLIKYRSFRTIVPSHRLCLVTPPHPRRKALSCARSVAFRYLKPQSLRAVQRSSRHPHARSITHAARIPLAALRRHCRGGRALYPRDATFDMSTFVSGRMLTLMSTRTRLTLRGHPLHILFPPPVWHSRAICRLLRFRWLSERRRRSGPGDLRRRRARPARRRPCGYSLGTRRRARRLGLIILIWVRVVNFTGADRVRRNVRVVGVYSCNISS